MCAGRSRPAEAADPTRMRIRGSVYKMDPPLQVTGASVLSLLSNRYLRRPCHHAAAQYGSLWRRARSTNRMNEVRSKCIAPEFLQGLIEKERQSER